MPFTGGPPGLELDAGASIAIAAQRFPSFARALKIRPWPGPSSYTTHTRHPFHSNDTAKKKEHHWRHWNIVQLAVLGWAGQSWDVGREWHFLLFFLETRWCLSIRPAKIPWPTPTPPHPPVWHSLSLLPSPFIFFYSVPILSFYDQYNAFSLWSCLSAGGFRFISTMTVRVSFFVVAPHLVLLFDGPHRIEKSNRCSRDFGLFLLFFMRCFRVSVIDFNGSL